jgi:hypothetical protein
MTKIIDSKEIENRIANATKPISNSNYKYPLNQLDDRVFEILTYSIFKKRLQSENGKVHDIYDDVILMQGVGEKGMDCMLIKNNKTSGIIQCKKYASNLNHTVLLKEIIKFAIHYYIDNSLFLPIDCLRYYIATTTGYTGKAIELKQKLNDKSFLKENDFDKLVSDTLKRFKEFKSLKLDDIRDELISIISKLKYEFILPQDIDIWINSYSIISTTFFEVKSVTDNKLIKNESEVIKKKLDTILSREENVNFSEFLDKYISVAKSKLNTINFIGFDLHRHRQKPTDITLTDLYVQPYFKQRKLEKNKLVASLTDKNLKIANIFKSDKNIIILGDPGAGKSLLVKFLIIKILEKQSHDVGMLKYEKYIPFRITLRKYYEVRESKSFLDYLLDVLNNQYHTSINYSLLLKIFKDKDTLVFFDGLDEIFNVKHKNQLKELIESFSISFPKSKCVVTSRFIGYHDVKFKSESFDEFAIKKLDQNQIDELVSKFYSSQIPNLTRRKSFIDNCLEQLEKDIDDELKSNPLILSLILILTSNNIVIPDSKLEIYESCTKTLVESIDAKEKELKFAIPVKNKRITFANLAYWQYESMSNESDITYDKAKRVISELLLKRKEAQELPEAEDIAEKFLEYAERRSIYFEDNFTHKTFLEYYTSDFLYINYFTKASDSARKELISIFTKYLPNPFWYIVFELLISRIDNEQADNEVLDEFLSKQLNSNSIDVFYFLVSNIASIVNVSDDIKVKILRRTIELCIKGEKISKKSTKFSFEENSVIVKIYDLREDPIIKEIIQNLVYEFEKGLTTEKKLIDFYNFLFELKSLESSEEECIKFKNSEKVNELALKDNFLFLQVFVKYDNDRKSLKSETLIQQIENFGTKSLFKDFDFKYRENVTRINTFDFFLMTIIENQDSEGFVNCLNEIKNFGIKTAQIIKHVKETRLYYFHRGKGFTKILDLFVKSQDETLDTVLKNLIRNNAEMRNLYEKYKKEKPNNKLKQIDELFKKNQPLTRGK